MMFKSLKELALDKIHSDVNSQNPKPLARSGICSINASIMELNFVDEFEELQDSLIAGDTLHKFLQLYFTEGVRYYELTETASPAPLHYVTVANSGDRYLVIFTAVKLLNDVVHASWMAFYEPYMPKPKYENNPETIARVSEFLESTKCS